MNRPVLGGKRNKRSLALDMFLCSLLLGGFAAAQQSADEAAIRKADTNWAKAAQTKKVEAWMAFYSEDATVLPPNDQLAQSKSAIRKSINDLLSLPDLSIAWRPAKVEVAQSADIAYSYGTYKLNFSGPAGNPTEDRGKYLEIWKKQKDGTWKCAVDTWNSDLPAK
ncbi:MAG TPA: DUF4440 domain-containing protein [Verrucomicrobiae bacterium]|jgi:ketosteroid isomerase-like protein|nr:DUF4440 domain-containing protein [Verrucomicrobiae bacterium]